jgi:hypothetical protein
METTLYDLPKDMLIKLITTISDIDNFSDEQVQNNYRKYKAEIAKRKCYKIKEYLLTKMKDEDSVRIVQSIIAIEYNDNEEIDITIIDDTLENFAIKIKRNSCEDIRGSIYSGNVLICRRQIMPDDLMTWYFFSEFPNYKRYEDFIDIVRQKFDSIYNYLVEKDNLTKPIKWY